MDGLSGWFTEAISELFPLYLSLDFVVEEKNLLR